ncbi:aldehyde dehydrogenase family protein [Crystallibacter crystallopoietes]|uniref:aldehyde dehydrogenase family protein n=1 Tax=Crystallibacter crystallopoietes TaxID=37928 RepID=UPI0003156AB9|nr:aldehyde dehydrogenase family protein [Arthrobacter crystallopoietes]
MTATYSNYVDGQFTTTATDYLDVTNPATNDLLARVPETDAAEVDRAVAAAR